MREQAPAVGARLLHQISAIANDGIESIAESGREIIGGRQAPRGTAGQWCLR